ncbi:hypothetical protein A2U01_0003130 [Trifolium medium]|uniref:Uncharacterized protein n=1 Tax=Trifolium medium TaxID=97028 RepID=A0A392M4J9_9FABA|nr:hypothetical protein [Trifolium medium]
MRSWQQLQTVSGSPAPHAQKPAPHAQITATTGFSDFLLPRFQDILNKKKKLMLEKQVPNPLFIGWTLSD